MEVSSFSDINIDTDLKSGAVSHVRFLSRVNKYPGLYGGPVLQRAIWRYREMWLPLAAEHTDEVLSAPLDIEWVWHCHLLAPVRYSEDCQNNYNTIVEHIVQDGEVYDRALAVSEHYWNQKYPGIPFNVDLENCQGDSNPNERSKTYEILYDIETAAGRQRMFYYQVSLPHYLDVKFLEKGLQRYKKFLFLKSRNPNTFLVPCYDIDLLWHTHMNFSVSYRTVTELLLGQVLNHDDSVNDRSEGSKLNVSDAKTRQLWKSTFNEHFASYGAMWRGDPPEGKLHSITLQDCFSLVSKHTNIKFDRIEIQGQRKDALTKFKVHIRERDIIVMSGNVQGEKEIVDISEKLFTLKGPQLNWENCGNIRKSLHCLKSDNLCLQILQGQSVLCCSNGSSQIGEGQIDLDRFAAKFVKVKQSLCEQVKVDIDTDLSADVTMTLTLTKLGQCDLWLVPGTYEECVMPEQIESLWGPVPLPRLPPGVINNCSVASHRLKDYRGKVQFTCRVVHSLPLMMSSVQVFYHDKMMAVAHVIGSDQLPKPENVGDLQSCVTLEPKKGERAMLIKNGAGDWGIVIGRWDGYKRGVPAKRGTRTNPGRPGSAGRPGYLTLLFYKTKTQKWELLSLEDPYATEEFRFKFSDAKVDLKIGKISVNGEKNEIAEHLALTFCVSLLHVFLQPRPANWEPGESLEPEVSKRGARNVRYVKSEKLSLILAAGLLIATPSNHFLRNKMKERAEGFGRGGIIATENEPCENDQHGDQEGFSASVFGGDRGDDGAKPEDIVTQLLGDENEDRTGETNHETLMDELYGGDDNHDDNGGFEAEYNTGANNYDDMYGELSGGDFYGEDFNTFLGDVDFGTTGGDGNAGEGGDSGWSFGYDDGGVGGCGGCGAACGGGGMFGGGDLGGGDGGSGGFSGVGWSGGAFDSGGGDSGGGGGGWLEGFSGMDTGGGDGGGWGDGGGGGDGGEGGDGGGCGGCGGCGG